MLLPVDLIRGRARGVQTSFGTIRRFRHELYPHWRSLLGALICGLGYTAMRLAEPWPLKFIFDNVLAGAPLDTPVPWLDRQLADDRMRILLAATGAILLFAALRGLFYYYQSYLTSRVGQSVVLAVRRQLFAHLQRLSLRYHRQNRTGDLLARLTSDVSMLRDLLVASLLSLVSESIIIVGFIVVMFLMNWRLALLAIVIIPVIFTLVRFYSRRIKQAARKQRRREGEIAARLQETLSGIHVVQLFAREPDEDERLRVLNTRSLLSGLQASRLEARLNQGVELSVAVGMAVTLWFGATEVIAGRLTPGELIVFVSYLQSFYRPLRRISRVTERASKAASSIERITDVLDQEAEVRDGPTTAPRFAGAIHFDGVSFGYDDTPLLDGIDLEIAPGQTVALVGPSGAGKSSLIALIPRLYDPDDGTIRIDGRDNRDFTLASLREQIAVVPQDGLLFGGTVRENILYGKPDATEEEIEAAARAALIHDFVVGLPVGYETPINERGTSLSGGQRQRLAIARALAKDAPIVLLDEPTTGLDAESEDLVLAALDRLLHGRTAIVIAHRLATIRRADVILFVEDGRIVERGSHDELIARDGRYRALYDRQRGDKTQMPRSATTWGESRVQPSLEGPADARVDPIRSPVPTGVAR